MPTKVPLPRRISSGVEVRKRILTQLHSIGWRRLYQLGHITNGSQTWWMREKSLDRSVETANTSVCATGPRRSALTKLLPAPYIAGINLRPADRRSKVGEPKNESQFSSATGKDVCAQIDCGGPHLRMCIDHCFQRGGTARNRAHHTRNDCGARGKPCLFVGTCHRNARLRLPAVGDWSVLDRQCRPS